MKNKTIAAMILIGTCAISTADTAFFDFESDPGNLPNATPYTNYTLSDGTLIGTMSRDSGAGFGVVDTSPFVGTDFDFPPSWGSRSLDPFGNTTDDWFVINFNQAIETFSIQFGDFGADVDDIELEGYTGLDGTGDLADSNSFTGYEGNMDLDGFGESISIGFALTDQPNNIMSVRFRGGSSIQSQSLYWDNIEINYDAVPEPATITALSLGALALIRRRKTN